MPATLDSLPFDAFHAIANKLNVREYIQLTQVCKKINDVLRTESTARIVLRQSIASAREEEADFTRSDTHFQRAVGRAYSIREAIRTAQPYSASIVAYGTAFMYNDGVLCYSNHKEIRILDIHSCVQKEICIDVSQWKSHLAPNHLNQNLSDDTRLRISHLSYAKGIVACLCKVTEVGESWLFVFDINDSGDPKGKPKHKVLLREPLACTTKLFIRHDSSYLYYGTHSVLGSHGHHEWSIQGFNLITGYPLSEKPLQLVNFFGSELGSTACFGVHDGSFYAVSSQVSLEDEEIDWTSHYHCIQFRLDDPQPDIRPRKLWRRQHKEGPINDSWTELSLQKDEQTDELLIVECRKEYKDGGSVNVRTYYTEPLILSDIDVVPKNHGLPLNDPLTKTLDTSSKPNYEPAKKRIRRYCHPEYDLDRAGNGKYASQDFILAKTKFRTYNPAASSFIDLVNDPVSRPGFARLQDRIRLRVASRLQKSPLIDDPTQPGHFLLRPTEVDLDDNPIERSEEDYHPTEVQELWPPNNAPAELFDILYPGGRVEQLDAMADGHAIIYMTGPQSANPNGERPIILISFDPAWRHDGLKKISLHSDPSSLVDMEVDKDSPGNTSNRLKRPSPMSLDSEDESLPQKRQKGAAEASAAGDLTHHQHQQWKSAQYLEISRGYWFRHGR